MWELEEHQIETWRGTTRPCNIRKIRKPSFVRRTMDPNNLIACTNIYKTITCITKAPFLQHAPFPLEFFLFFSHKIIIICLTEMKPDQCSAEMKPMELMRTMVFPEIFFQDL